jgi:hypothetical protein
MSLVAQSVSTSHGRRASATASGTGPRGPRATADLCHALRRSVQYGSIARTNVRLPYAIGGQRPSALSNPHSPAA